MDSSIFFRRLKTRKKQTARKLCLFYLFFFHAPLLLLWQKAGMCRTVSVVLSVLQVSDAGVRQVAWGQDRWKKAKIWGPLNEYEALYFSFCLCTLFLPSQRWEMSVFV